MAEPAKKEDEDLTKPNPKGFAANKPTTLEDRVSTLPESDKRQVFVTWKVIVANNNLLIGYTGESGWVIYVSARNLISLLKEIENHKRFEHKGRILLKIQQVNNEYIYKALTRNKGKSNQNEISFKFIRANLESLKFFLYQNTFEVAENTNSIESLVNSTLIILTYDQIMSPLEHISSLPYDSVMNVSDENFVDDV